MLNIKQQTIQKQVTLSGVGLHTGIQTTMTFLPAKPNHGIKFQRVDLPGSPVIDADCDNVVDVSRGTLASRIKEAEEIGLIEKGIRKSNGSPAYALTEEGEKTKQQGDKKAK